MQEQEASLTTGHLDLLESLPVMIMDLDGDGAVVFANQRARDGLSLGDGHLDVSIAELLDPTSRDAVLAQIRELWSGEGDITSTWKLRTRAGKALQVDANAISIHENSYPIRVRLYLHDGSAARPAPQAPAQTAAAAAAAAQAQLVGPIEARAALKEEREYTKALIQKSGLLVYIFDTKGTVVEINKKMEDLTGFTREMCPNLDALLKGLYPDERYRKIVSDVHKNMFKNQHLRETELKISNIRGEVKHISWSTARLKNAKGEVHGFIAAGMDVTEKKRLEHWAKLQASCLERVSDAVIISDLRGDIIQWLGRAEEMLGFNADEVMGKLFTSFFPEDDRKLVDHLLADDIEKVGQWKAEIDLQTKDGAYRACQVEVVVVRNEGGQPIALVTLIRDRETDKESEDRIGDLERRVSDAVAQMEVFRARGDQLEVQLKEEQARAENYLARADVMAHKNRDLEDEVARQASGRAALEQAIEELSIFQLSLLGVSAISLVTTDGGGTVTNWSRGAEEFTGLTAREAMGRRLHDEVFMVEGYSWDSIVQETLDRGSFRAPVTLNRADGSRKPIILDTSVLNDQHGNAVGLTEVAIEFSGPASDPEVEKALFEARATSLLGELTPAILRVAGDTFSGMEANLQLLETRTRALRHLVELYRGDAPRSDIESYARRVDVPGVLSGVDRATATALDQLRELRSLSGDLARFLPGAADEVEIVSLNEIADLALNLARGSVVSHARIDRSYGPRTTVLASANEAARASLHLLLAAGHALDGNGQDGIIRISTGSEGDRVWLEVSHNGTPVGADVQAHLGDPSALVKMSQGTAVALGLAHKIAVSLGGQLFVRDGQGAEAYRLELPLTEADVAPAPGDADDAPERPWGKVIFIEPEASQRRSWANVYAGRFEVETAGNIEDLKAALKTKPKAQAIVISGASAEAVDGFYAFLKDYNKELTTKVVFLLPAGLSAEQRRAFRRTGRVMMERPVAPENLEGILRMVVGS